MGDMIGDGAEFSCPFCTSKIKIKVLSSPTTGDGKKIANKANHIFPPPGGQCTIIPNAPVPCVPAVTIVDEGQSPVSLSNIPGLGKGCKGMCAKGGTLTVSSPGQGVSIHDGAAGAGALGALTGQLIDAASKNNPDDEEEKKDEKNQSDGSKKKSNSQNPSKANSNPQPRINPKREGHIFRNAPGHVNPSSPHSQKRYYSMMQKTASNKANEIPKNMLSKHKQDAGIKTFKQAYKRGEVWVETRNNEIMNGGVNKLIKPGK